MTNSCDVVVLTGQALVRECLPLGRVPVVDRGLANDTDLAAVGERLQIFVLTEPKLTGPVFTEVSLDAGDLQAVARHRGDQIGGTAPLPSADLERIEDHLDVRGSADRVVVVQHHRNVRPGGGGQGTTRESRVRRDQHEHRRPVRDRRLDLALLTGGIALGVANGDRRLRREQLQEVGEQGFVSLHEAGGRGVRQEEVDLLRAVVPRRRRGRACTEDHRRNRHRDAERANPCLHEPVFMSSRTSRLIVPSLEIPAVEAGYACPPRLSKFSVPDRRTLSAGMRRRG